MRRRALTPDVGAARTLELVSALRQLRGIAPTIRELAQPLGLAPASVHKHIHRLKYLGYVALAEPGDRRSIRTTREGEAWLDRNVRTVEIRHLD